MTPNTRKVKIDEIEKKKVGKLKNVRTYFTLLKGFVCAGSLYLPTNVKEGGWLFSAIGLFLSYVFTNFCFRQLLNSLKASEGTTFKDIGVKAYGKTG